MSWEKYIYLDSNIIFLVITILCLLLLYIINKQLRNRQIKSFIFLIVFAEAINLSFFYQKYPFYLSIFIIFLSGYYLVRSNVATNIFPNDRRSSFFPQVFTDNFQYISLIILLSVIFYEFQSDRKISENGIFFLIFSIVLFSYSYINSNYQHEKDFIVFFGFLLLMFFQMPKFVYKLIYGEVGLPSENFWFNTSDITAFLLAKPLASFMTLLGYNVISDNDFVYYEDTVSGLFTPVEIGLACSGIASVQIFMAAFISYVLVYFRRFDLEIVLLILLGLLISYMANMLRMSIVLLSGHYFGMEFFLWVHKYIGFLIFTTWMLLFWRFADYFLNPKRGIS